jgi:hypothetical protein
VVKMAANGFLSVGLYLMQIGTMVVGDLVFRLGRAEVLPEERLAVGQGILAAAQGCEPCIRHR